MFNANKNIRRVNPMFHYILYKGKKFVFTAFRHKPHNSLFLCQNRINSRILNIQ